MNSLLDLYLAISTVRNVHDAGNVYYLFQLGQQPAEKEYKKITNVLFSYS